MVRRRTHSRDFKLMVIRQIASGEKRPAQICRQRASRLSARACSRQEYAARGEAAFTPKDLNAPDALQQRTAELERFCGQLALENSVLKKGLASSRSRSDTP